MYFKDSRVRAQGISIITILTIVLILTARAANPGG